MIKHPLNVFLLSLLLLCAIVTGVPISAIDNAKSPSIMQEQTPKVYIEPQNGTANVGQDYTISVKIANVTNLAGFGINLRWGAAVLRYKSREVFESAVLITGFVVRNELNEAYGLPEAPRGTLYVLSCTSLANIGFNGSGTVLNMTFQVIRDGECFISFTGTDLSGPSVGGVAPEIPHISEGAYFYRSGLGKIPVANFTVWPKPPVVNRTATFDASASYDQDPGGNISRYIWNFGDGTLENTTEPVVTHAFTAATDEMIAELTVLDDQGAEPGGSQSNPEYMAFKVLLPNPVAVLTVTPSPAAVNRTIVFDASGSFDPDPGGTITRYIWNFADGTVQNTTTSITNHTYTMIGTYGMNLTVIDSEGLSGITRKQLRVVEKRDIGLAGLDVSPTELLREEIAAINFTVINRGQVDESFNITAYYNKTVAEWTQIDEFSLTGFIGQNKTLSSTGLYEPMKWELTNLDSTNNTMNGRLVWEPRGLAAYPTQLLNPDFNRTIIDVGTSVGYWTLNPNEENDVTGSPTLIAETPVTTGGWLLEKPTSVGVQILDGEFMAGNWTTSLRLYATSYDITATIWMRILKSDSPDSQAAGANVEVVKDWTRLFEPVLFMKSRANASLGRVTSETFLPAMNFADEYFLAEFQLQVTENLGGDANAKVVLEMGGPVEARTEVLPTAFSPQEQYTFLWDTTLVPPGNYSVKVESSEIPHEADLNNNVLYSGNIHVMARAPVAEFSFTPVTPFPGEIVAFDASPTYVDLFLNITSYVWDFGDGNNETATTPAVTHTYDAVGNYAVNLTATDSFGQTSFKSKQISVEAEYVPLDITIDVGAVYFRGETAEFYILVSRSGGRVDASAIAAFIIFNRTVFDIDPADIEWVATGIYLISFAVPADASPGTYVLVVDASFLVPPNINLQGTALGSFLVSSTLTDWNAKLVSINGTLMTVNSTVGLIQADVEAINARLVEINGTLATLNSTLGLIQADVTTIGATLVAVQGMVADIDSSVGTLETTVTAINATVTSISGEVATINTTLGDVQTSIGGLSSTVTIGLAAASALSAVAAIVAILIFMRLRKTR